jgi:hypothetical protein
LGAGGDQDLLFRNKLFSLQACFPPRPCAAFRFLAAQLALRVEF